MTKATDFWPGCHGVRLLDAPFDFGPTVGTPLLTVRVDRGDVPRPEGPALWEQRFNVAGVSVTRSLVAHGSGRFVLDASSGPRIAIDASHPSIVVSDGDGFVSQQLVAAFALPALLHDREVLLVHGAACARDDRAVVIVGESGVGKSSSLVALTDAGWSPISEDVCAIDVSGDVPRVWPGPPWVRALHGEPGPVGSAVYGENTEKTAWSIAGRQLHRSVPVDRLIVLGAAPVNEVAPLDAAAALKALAPHTVWLRDPVERVRRVFPLAAGFVHDVPATRLALARHAGWRGDLLALIT